MAHTSWCSASTGGSSAADASGSRRGRAQLDEVHRGDDERTAHQHPAGQVPARPGVRGRARGPLGACQRRLRARRRAPAHGPHRAEMAAKLAAALGIEADRVAVRATTTDHLGFTGREEGLAAQAVALLQRERSAAPASKRRSARSGSSPPTTGCAGSTSTARASARRPLRRPRRGGSAARGVLRRRADRLRPAARPRRDRLPAPLLARARDDPVRADGQLRRAGAAARRSARDAARAVGAANGQNPLPLVLPCHRVVGADGSLTGFGGGLHVKRFLLEHEGALLPL